MILEATDAPFRFHFTDGQVVRFAPGEPVTLEEEKARRLLAKAAGKVKVIGQAPPCAPIFHDGDRVSFDHWTDILIGTVDGPPWFEDRAGLAAGYWYLIHLEEDSSYSYVHESRLR